jgi:TRAP transporter TAXI family solute receptor
MKKRGRVKLLLVAIMATVVVATVIFSGSTWARAAEKQVTQGLPKAISMGTKAPGSSSYSTWIPIVNVINKHVPFRVVAEPIGGLPDYLAAMARGELEMFSVADTSGAQAIMGLGPFKKMGPQTQLRMFSSGYEVYYIYQVVADSDIYTPRDLVGKKCLVDCHRIPMNIAVADAIEENYGLKGKWHRFPFDSNAEAAQQVIEGRADLSSGVVAPYTLKIDNARGVRILPFTQSDLDKFREIVAGGLPVAGLGTVPKPTLGIKGDIYNKPVFILYHVTFVHKDVSEEAAYLLVKAMYDHYDEYKDAYLRCAQQSLDRALQTQLAPYHPGVMRYYKEKGLWTNNIEQRNQKLIDRFKELDSRR